MLIMQKCYMHVHTCFMRNVHAILMFKLTVFKCNHLTNTITSYAKNAIAITSR